ncbi:MAG: protein-L-isoaspartate(D-aspartate) O-methyltransferase [Pirellulales bacterium]|nr:protein-L-isoaspartate(D-aspartate) O-methyltransferase [Pirellulales bacterium]
MARDGRERDSDDEERHYAAVERARMVDRQLPGHGIVDPQILNAMAAIPREEFVPRHLRESAYIDSSLPIGCDQTISQPCVTALMCELAQLVGAERVLDVGTGSGYAAAVLSLLAAEVISIERIDELAERARRRLARLGFGNVTVVIGDGTRGWPERAPYDAILVAAGATALPKALVEQLAEGGRLIIPVGRFRRGQTMYRFTNQGAGLKIEDFGAFSFVPLIAGDNDDARE